MGRLSDGLKRTYPEIFLVILSGISLILIFPPFGMHFLAWVALVPLLLLIRRSSSIMIFIASMSAGLIFFSGLLWWLLSTKGVNPFNFTVGVLLKAFLSLGLFGLLANYFQKKNPSWNALTFPAIWVALEYLRSHMAFLSSPWGMMGYSQYLFLPIVQVSSFIGVYGVSFLIVAVNTVIAEIIHSYLSTYKVKDFRVAPRPINKKLSGSVMAGILILFCSVFLYGLSSVSGKIEYPQLKIALIQGNAYTTGKVDSLYKEMVYRRYCDLTQSASDAKPEIIAWPCSSVPGRIPYDYSLVQMLSGIARRAGSYFLVGTSGFDKFNPSERKERGVSNSAFLFSPQGSILGRYDKIRLTPFDEYLPLRHYVKWPSWIATDMIDYLPGREVTIFDMGRAKFGVKICWENLFPEDFREMAAKGVNFMISMTNEGFTKIPAGHHQILAVNIFRAVENHVAIARIASTGVSCIIDPQGRIIKRVRDQNLNDANIEGYVVAGVPLTSERSLYNRYGDWFVYALIVALAMFIFWNEIGNRILIKFRK